MVSPSTAISRLIPSLLLGTVRTALDFPAEMANFYTGGDPDQCSGIEQLIRSKGYPFERHNVITSDGYIIEMHRIPHGREPCKEPCHRQPILLMSGLLGDSSNYVLDFPKQSLGYVLADHKYDVWMGNVRGNTYGKRHKKFNARSRRFWNFSFHEHSKYDLPAQIDYVLKNTSRTDLLYLGLSQGTLMFFTMMSEKPKYNDKVKAFAGLAPFNKLSHMDVDALAMLVPLADHITLIKSKKATKFDYGPEDNKIYYGQDLGPLVKKNHFIDDPYYTHLHFAMALNNPRLLYKDLLEFLDQYATSS
ncbi:hypothetical protein HPB52_000173 [Rhipicephalus sanguineus]|uniref:Partial AB-hydrolase lipase domain-containing protein n=1 Tax=Rhipicephalus sanguineus TaxID=34632 RepID=A0A9D4SNH3_RHISA|nr:hypothetical protein HPB52_000173 [Rhipicephalus sanguineus]